MPSRMIFGRYIPGLSYVHRLDPRTKLLGMFVLVVLLFVAQTFWTLGLIGVFTIAIYVVARIPLIDALRAIGPLSFIVILTALFNLLFVDGGVTYVDIGWLRITSLGVESALFVSVRLLLLLLIGSLLTLTTPSIWISRAIAFVLSPLTRVGVPVHEFAFVMGTALRFLPQFFEELRYIRVAQASRGSHLPTSKNKGMASITSLVVPLFASVFRHADTLSAAMESRCFQLGTTVRVMRETKPTWRDAVAGIVLGALAAGVIALSCW